MSTKSKRVAVGMSGGVDSSMAVHLLQQAGYEVIGLTMRIWDGRIPIPDEGRGGCIGPHSDLHIARAQELAQRLGIEHHVIPLEKEYRHEVLEYFCRTYVAGKTPNPCIQCNRLIKLGALIESAKTKGIPFDHFATGHYARIHQDDQTGHYHLLRGMDHDKDQSYFLSYLSQSQLASLLFPLGKLQKADIKKLARELGFGELADREESQDFLACSDYTILFPPDASRPGEFVSQDGQVLGRHRGLIHYTIGQRKGLGLGGGGTPFFVLELQPESNRVVVGPQEALWQNTMQVSKPNWIAWDVPPSDSWNCHVQIRQRHRAAPAHVTVEKEFIRVTFEEPQLAITPGQVAVFYDHETVLGAGEIHDAGK